MIIAAATQQPPKPISAPAPPADDIIGKAYDPQVTRRLLTYLRPYRANIVAALVMMAITMTGFIAGPYLIKVALDGVAARDAIRKPLAEYNRLRANEPPVAIEPALVDAVLDQVKTGAVIIGEGRGIVARKADKTEIETPYLQLVMTRLWDEEMGARSQTLRFETLDALGGAERERAGCRGARVQPTGHAVGCKNRAHDS